MSGANAEVKKAASSIFENYFEANYAPLPLPLIWRVVYHEAVRGNHILWEKADLDAIEAQYGSSSFKLAPEDTSAVTRFMARFFSTVDYADLKKMLRLLPIQQKAVVFLLYRRAISVWQSWLKLNLH